MPEPTTTFVSYIDGVQQVSVPYTVPATNNTLVGIGIEDTGAPALYFSGTIDDVYFYNRALSEPEVQQLMSDSGL